MGQNKKPTTAFILSLIAGVFILTHGAMGLLFSAIMRSSLSLWSSMMRGEWPGMMLGWWSGLGIALSIFGVAIGLIVIYSAIMLNSQPQNHKTWGILILVFSIVSFVGAWAGLRIGLILGIIGGALAIGWTPSTPTPSTTPQVTGKVCTNCGQAVSEDVKFCPKCGKELPT